MLDGRALVAAGCAPRPLPQHIARRASGSRRPRTPAARDAGAARSSATAKASRAAGRLVWFGLPWDAGLVDRSRTRHCAIASLFIWRCLQY